MDRSGVYQISFGDCDSVYVGQTSRKFSTRLKEHISYPNVSKVCEHLNCCDHDKEKVSFKVITLEDKKSRLEVIESVEIVKLFKHMPREKILNTQLGPLSGCSCELAPPPGQKCWTLESLTAEIELVCLYSFSACWPLLTSWSDVYVTTNS